MAWEAWSSVKMKMMLGGSAAGWVSSPNVGVAMAVKDRAKAQVRGVRCVRVFMVDLRPVGPMNVTIGRSV